MILIVRDRFFCKILCFKYRIKSPKIPYNFKFISLFVFYSHVESYNNFSKENEMSFVSISELSKNSTKRSRNTSSTLPLIGITQTYLEHRGSCTISIRFSPECMQNARLQKGDRIDVLFNPETKQWKVSIAEKGYKISGNGVSTVGVVRFTYFEGMPNIAPEKQRKAKAIGLEDSIVYKPGEVIFSLGEADLSENENEI